MFFDPKCPACADADSFLLNVVERSPEIRVAFHYMPWEEHKDSYELCVLMEQYAEGHPFPQAIRRVNEFGSADSLELLVQALNIGSNDVARLKNPLDRARLRVKADVMLGERLNVVQTPTIIEVTPWGKRLIDVVELKSKYG